MWILKINNNNIYIKLKYTKILFIFFIIFILIFDLITCELLPISSTKKENNFYNDRKEDIFLNKDLDNEASGSGKLYVGEVLSENFGVSSTGDGLESNGGNQFNLDNFKGLNNHDNVFEGSQLYNTYIDNYNNKFNNYNNNINKGYQEKYTKQLLNKYDINNNNNEKLPFDIITFSKNNNNDIKNNYKIIGAKFNRDNTDKFEEPISKDISNFNIYSNNNKNNIKEIIGTKNLMKYLNEEIEKDALKPEVDNNENDRNFDIKNTQSSIWYPKNNNNFKQTNNNIIQNKNYDKNNVDIQINKQKLIYYPKSIENENDKIDFNDKESGNVQNYEDVKNVKQKFNEDYKNNLKSYPIELNRSKKYEDYEGEVEDEDFEPPPPPKDYDEERVRSFVSDHEYPRDVPTRLNYPGGGLWGKPVKNSGIKIDFVPQQFYSQTRRSSVVKFLPQEEAIAAASTPEEVVNAPRLREVVSHKKIQEVYEEEGYEDSAYDHGGYKKKSKHAEDKAKASLASIPEYDIVGVHDQTEALNDHEKYLQRPIGDDDHESQSSKQKQIVQKETPYGQPKVRTWKSEKTTSNEKSLTFLDNRGKSDIHVQRPQPTTQGIIGRSIEYINTKDKELDKYIPDGIHSINTNLNKGFIRKQLDLDTVTQQSSPSRQTTKLTRTNNDENSDGNEKLSREIHRERFNYELKKDNNKQPVNYDKENEHPRSNSKKPKIKSLTNKSNEKTYQDEQKTNQKSQEPYSISFGEPDELEEYRKGIDPNHPSSFYSGSFIYNKPKMIQLKTSGLPVDEALISEYDDEYQEKNTDKSSNQNKENDSQDYQEEDYDEHKSSTNPNSKEFRPRYIPNVQKPTQNQHPTKVISRNSGGILTQWSTPAQINPVSYDTRYQKQSSLTKRNPTYKNNYFKNEKQNDGIHKITETSTNPSSIKSLTSQIKFPSWNEENLQLESSLFESTSTSLENDDSKSSNKDSNSKYKNYKIIPRSTNGFLKSPKLYQSDEWTPLIKHIKNPKFSFRNIKIPSIPLSDEIESSESERITTTENFEDVITIEDTKPKYSEVILPESDSKSVKHIEKLTLAHYSNPSPIFTYNPISLSQQNRLKNLADELNKPTESDKHYDGNSEKTVSINDSKNKRHKRSAAYDDESRISEKNYKKRLPKNVELINFESDSTTTQIPVDTRKYPFYKSLPSEGLEKFSPLRYATNPEFIPKKSGSGMEFYESRDHIECEEPSPPDNIVPKRNKDGEWNSNPIPDGPRIKGLGDKITCLRTKYFGKDPLDNPFFKEDTVGVPKTFASERKSDIEDQLGLYIDIMSNIKSNNHNSLPGIHSRRPTRNVTLNLNDKFKGYGKKYSNGYKPYYGKFNKYSSTYTTLDGKTYNHKQQLNNRFQGNNKLNRVNDAQTSSSYTNLLTHGNNQWNNNYNPQNNNNNNVNNKNENFDSFVPSYLPIRDDTVATLDSATMQYNNACKHYEYLLKPLMSMVPPPEVTFPQPTHNEENRKKRKPIKPKLYPTSIYSYLNSDDNKNNHKPGGRGKRQRFVRNHNKFHTRPPYRFSYSQQNSNNKNSLIGENDNVANGASLYHTTIKIKEIDEIPRIKEMEPHYHEYYTILSRSKRDTRKKRRKVILHYYKGKLPPQYKITIAKKRPKRNLNYDQLEQPKSDYDLPITLNHDNKYHKIISRDDRETLNTTLENNNNNITSNNNSSRPFKKLSQELILTLHVVDNDNATDHSNSTIDNDRPQRKAIFKDKPNDSLISQGDTVFAGSRKIESSTTTVNLNLDSNNDELKSGNLQVTRLSGGFISRHSPVFSSKYNKQQGIKVDNNSIPITQSNIENSEITKENPNLTTDNINNPLNNDNGKVTDITSAPSTTSSRLKVRFPKLNAKPTVAIIPEDQTKPPKQRTNTQKVVPLTTTTTTTTEQTPLSTTRMYKPKRVFKKENNRGKIVDAFAVLNRQRDSSSEKSQITTGSPILPSTLGDIYQESVTPDEEEVVITPTTKRSSSRNNFRNTNPRNVHIEHRRITKSEVTKRTYSTNDKPDEIEYRSTRDFFDHPDLRDPTARISNQNTNDKIIEDEVGASSNKDEVINETLMYVVDPITGFGHWAIEPNQNAIISSTSKPLARSSQTFKPNNDQKFQNSDINYRQRNRGKSKYRDEYSTKYSKEKLNKDNYQGLNPSPTIAVNTESDYQRIKPIKYTSRQRDPSLSDKNNKRQRGRNFKNKQSAVTTVDKEVYVLESLLTHIPPYPTIATLPDDEVIIGRKKETPTSPRIIVEPDKRMYYYLPEK